MQCNSVFEVKKGNEVWKKVRGFKIARGYNITSDRDAFQDPENNLFVIIVAVDRSLLGFRATWWEVG